MTAWPPEGTGVVAVLTFPGALYRVAAVARVRPLARGIVAMLAAFVAVTAVGVNRVTPADACTFVPPEPPYEAIPVLVEAVPMGYARDGTVRLLVLRAFKGDAPLIARIVPLNSSCDISLDPDAHRWVLGLAPIPGGFRASVSMVIFAGPEAGRAYYDAVEPVYEALGAGRAPRLPWGTWTRW